MVVVMVLVMVMAMVQMVLVMVVTVYLHHFYLFSISTADSAATCVSAVLSAARSIPAKSTPSPFTWWNSRSDFW